MLLTRRTQVLAKVQDVDGVAVSPSSSDGVLIYDPEYSEDTAYADRVPASATLSRDNTPPGLVKGSLSFSSDFRGSGAIATAPEWGKLARACGHREQNLVRLTLTGMSSTERLQVGEIVQQSSGAVRGICLTDLLGANGDILVLPIVGTFTAAALVGESAAATATVSAVDSTDEGWAYSPDSLRLVQWSSGAWAASTPSGVGVVLRIVRAGFDVGAVQVVQLGTGSSWVAGVYGVLLWGTLANGDVLTDASGNAATLSATPTTPRTPCMTANSNLDGLLRQLVDARGDFTLEGAAGEPLVFRWNFTGRPVAHTAALPVTVTTLGTTRAPRLFGCFAGIGYGSQFYRLPVRQVTIAPGNTLGVRQDVGSTGGYGGTLISNRKPKITIEVENVGLAFDWRTRMQSEQNVRLGIVLGGDGAGTWSGRTAGNTLAVAAPNCQVVSMSGGDADGIATYTIDLEPRRILEAGDDEYVLAMF